MKIKDILNNFKPFKRRKYKGPGRVNRRIGKEADILIINGNPLEDISVLKDKNKIQVFKKGVLI